MEETNKEVIMKTAWISRDTAVSSKNLMEVELAHSRIEVMQVSLDNIRKRLDGGTVPLHKM